LVEGNEYLLKLSRYVHLNPVKVEGMRRKPVVERLEALRSYPGQATVPEDASLRRQRRVCGVEAVLVTVAAYPGREFKGSVSARDSGVDVKTRNLRIRATLPNPDGALRPGMFAEVATLLPARQGVLTLPRTAITFAPYGSSVFLIEEKDGKPQVQRRPVNTGGAQGGRVEIVTGLAAGDQVVAVGQVKLRNGQEVKIDNSVLPAATAPMGP
jgi:membrane fusion protein (multidrug efflux system)